MKKLWLGFIWILLSFVGYAQQAEIVVFRHDMRWVDETKFPNYKNLWEFCQLPMK